MVTDNVVRIGITDQDRLRNKYEYNFVSCEVSGRYIVTEPMTDDLIKLNIMTLTNDKKEHKICELIVSRDDLNFIITWLNIYLKEKFTMRLNHEYDELLTKITENLAEKYKQGVTGDDKAEIHKTLNIIFELGIEKGSKNTLSVIVQRAERDIENSNHEIEEIFSCFTEE